MRTFKKGVGRRGQEDTSEPKGTSTDVRGGPDAGERQPASVVEFETPFPGWTSCLPSSCGTGRGTLLRKPRPANQRDSPRPKPTRHVSGRAHERNGRERPAADARAASNVTARENGSTRVFARARENVGGRGGGVSASGRETRRANVGPR